MHAVINSAAVVRIVGMIETFILTLLDDVEREDSGRSRCVTPRFREAGLIVTLQVASRDLH